MVHISLVHLSEIHGNNFWNYNWNISCENIQGNSLPENRGVVFVRTSAAI